MPLSSSETMLAFELWGNISFRTRVVFSPLFFSGRMSNLDVALCHFTRWFLLHSRTRLHPICIKSIRRITSIFGNDVSVSNCLDLAMKSFYGTGRQIRAHHFSVARGEYGAPWRLPMVKMSWSIEKQYRSKSMLLFVR